MERKIDDLESFICAFSFQHKHYLEKPVILTCGHAACYYCVDSFKKNTGLKQIKCLKCNGENSLEIDYKDDDLMKNHMKDNYDRIIESIKQEYEEKLKKAKGKNLRLKF